MARLTAFEVRAGRQCPPQIKKQLLPGIEISGWLPLAGEGKFGRAGMMVGMNRVGLLMPLRALRRCCWVAAAWRSRSCAD